MPITRVGGVSASPASGTGVSLSWSTAGGGSAPQAGDLAVLSWNGQSGLTWGGEIGAFALLDDQVADTGSHEGRIYYRLCDGINETGTLDLTQSAANKQTAVLEVYRGVHQTLPISDFAVRDESSAGTSHACSEVTTVAANEAIVTFIQERVTDSSTNYTAPTGYTKRQQPTPVGGGGSTSGAVADDGLAVSRSAGTNVTPPNWTNGVSTANVLTWTLALRPATQAVAVGQATETDTANAVAWAPKHRLIGQATETDLAFGPPITVDVDTAAETDEAFQVTPDLRPVVTWSVAIDWDGDGDFTTSGDDVTARALERTGLAVTYGRDQLRELSPMAAGAADLELNNISKDYSPDNADSPLSGKVLPARPVQITASKTGTTHNLFTGFTDGFDVKPARGERSVDISALDAVAKLKGARATTTLYKGIRTGAAIGEVLDAIGWPADLRDLDPGATVVRWWWAEDEDAFDAIQKLVQSEGPPAMLTSDEQGRIVFRDRHHRLLSSASTSAQATFTDESEAEPSFTDMAYDHGWSDIVNSVSVKVEEVDPSPEPETVWEDESVRNIGADETLELHVTLDNPVVLPGFVYAVHAGTTTPSVAQSSGQTVIIQIAAGAAGATISQLSMLAQPVTTSRSYTVLVEDQDSIDTYGKRSVEYEIPWAGFNDAQAVANIIIDASAQRRPIVTITLQSGTWFDSERLTEQLSRDLSDRVHVREPQTCVDHPFHIEHISHKALDAGLVLETTFGMERAIEQADNVFRFDDDEHGFDDGVFASVGLTDPEMLFRFDVTGQGFDDGVFAT